MTTIQGQELINPTSTPASTQYAPFWQLYYTTTTTATTGIMGIAVTGTTAIAGNTGTMGITSDVSGQFVLGSQDNSTVSFAISPLDGNVYVLYRPQLRPQTYYRSSFSDYFRLVGIDTLGPRNLLRSSPTVFILEPQEEGGFVAYSKEYSGAIGQGETEEEAISDLKEAISLLKEVLEEDKTRR